MMLLFWSFVILAACAESLLTHPHLIYTKSFLGPSMEWHDKEMVSHASNLIRSYQEVVRSKSKNPSLILSKRTLAEVDADPVSAAKELFFRDDLIVVSHGVQDGPEGPILNYSDLAGLKRWVSLSVVILQSTPFPS